DRERTVQLLREHHAEGRLDMEEFHERLNAAYEAKTMGDLDEILADLPGIDLYRLPSAGLRPAPPGTGGWLPSRRPSSSVTLKAGQWAAWTAAGAALALVWLTVGVISGGLAWLPWFLLIIIPWAIALRNRS
ncbi:MAG TPA: DUF1707 domain-containing protein, partial [Trebonia sp.]